ncbi:MAG TPA: two-component regulator propeller domain-containing protein, partial [Chryseolinea sp.]|nr:two-component regulator propeller domain-containing protein [Chryseolinea sp.]
GLNSYDGYSVKHFFAKDYPALMNDHVVRMVCDDKNRIWIQSADGYLTLLDENRRFQTINLTENNKRIALENLLPVSNRVMFISGGRIYGLQDENTKQFVRLPMQAEPLLSNQFEQINKWDEDKLVFSSNNVLFLFDVKKLKATNVAKVSGVVAAARLTDSTALVTSRNLKLCKVNFSSGIVNSYTNLKDQHGELMHKFPGSIERVQEQLFLITSPSAGIYLFDAIKGVLIRRQHDIFDNRTISSNHTSYAFTNDDGYTFVSSYGMGLDYFKINSTLTGVKTFFNDNASGDVYSGYINIITEDTRGNVWMGGAGALIKRNKSDEITIYRPEWKEQDYSAGIRALHIDKDDRIWAGLHNGLTVFNKQLKVLTHLNKGSGLPNSTINGITEGPDGTLWISTSKGICFIDPNTFEIRTPQTMPLLWAMEKKCNTIWFRNEQEVWIGTWDGAYKVNLSNGNANSYTTENGLVFNEVIGLAGDKNGSVYIGTRFGFHILEEGQPISSFKNINNRWPIDCYSMMQDHSGNIWFSSNDYIANYSPSTKQFKVYDEKAGINSSGFRFYAGYATRDDELIFGSHLGITHFKSENIQVADPPFSVLIHEMATADSLYHIVPGSSIELPHFTQSVSFSFSAVNFLRGKNTFYKYRLEGVDEKWVETKSLQRVTYNNLQPGHYRFSVNASGDGLNWVGASNPVVFHILTPWWHQDWFRLVSLLTAASLAVLIINLRIKKIRQQKENLETEKAINYLAISLHEQHTVDAILWDVAKNCIGHLKFEDCVIYLWVPVRDVLVQKAAWGPKTTDEDMIVNPIEIPIGKGVVGSVAKSGTAEIVTDTSRDPRYIVDDAVRLSEIAVPIMYDGKVLGVIDSEHSRKGFFRQKHLSILTTIASMCAQKMIRAEAEKEKQEAQLATLRHEREAVNAQLKSLRLQMNPHFLFNSLNAIQQMILAGEDRSATRYLSKFSRLLRLVLLHSDKDN